LREEVRRDGGDDAYCDGATDRIFLLVDIAARGFEFAKDGAGAREEGLTGFGEADGTAEAIEEARAEFVFKFHDLLRERRLRNVRLLGGTAERTGFGDGAKVTKLVKFHKVDSDSPAKTFLQTNARRICDWRHKEL